MDVQVRYTPVVLGANSTKTLPNKCNLGGFLPSVSGTIAITDGPGGPGLSGATVLASTAVTAGVWLWLPFVLQYAGATITLGGSAAGTLAVW